jgi:23S rRNA (cytidine1920-2'-O)/16S rRNA (cytidine1409-2'-O)-methyltransferase
VSPLPGPSGNVEFFVWLRRGPAVVDRDTIDDVVSAGPSGVPGERVTE